MTAAELVFVALVVWVAGRLGRLAWALVRGDGAKLRRIAVRLVITLAVYVAALVVASAWTGDRSVAIGQTRCFDDWCLTVTGVTWRPGSGASRYLDVTLRMENRGRRRPQGERGTALWLVDASGRTFEAAPAGSHPGFDMPLAPGTALDTARSFVVPADPLPAGLGVVYGHRGGVPMDWCILGAGGWLAAPPVVHVPPPTGDAARDR